MATAGKLGERGIISHEEPLSSQVTSLDALSRLLIMKGIFTENAFFVELKKIQQEYEKEKSEKQQ
jgi:hypothetical protein